MRNVLDNSCSRNQNTFFVQRLFFFNCAVYEIMWRNNVKSDRPQMTIWCMHIACWISKGANTPAEYLILTFPLQQFL